MMVDPGTVRRRLIAWTKDDPLGAEVAAVTLEADRLSVRGTAIGSDPEPYRLDYTLDTGAQFLTTRVTIDVTGQGWGRSLTLTRVDSGEWRAETSQHGTISLPDPGGDVSGFAGALDPDLGLSPMFNTMPVLRHRLLDIGSHADDMVMVWISVPDLQFHRSPQRYTHVTPATDVPAVVRFESVGEGEDFSAEVVFDADGLVIDYPEIAHRLRAHEGVVA
jgi:uncharacterized protein